MTLIATWNVNSIRTRLDHLMSWLRHRQPDIMLLQELKCLEEAFPFEALEDLGYNIVVQGQKTYNGVAILSKTPIEDVVDHLPSLPDDDHARYLEAFIPPFRVASVYVPNGKEVGSPSFDYKMAFMDALLTHACFLRDQEDPLILGGDYNIAPFVEDGHSPEAFLNGRLLCSLQEREKLRLFLNAGFIDAVRLQYPASLPQNRHIFSWWDYRANSFEQNKGYRIDHLLLSSQAADLFIEAGIDKELRGEPRPSDHVPVWIKL